MTPSNDFDIYVPVYDTIPDEKDGQKEFLVERLREHANGINSRDFGYYIDKEIINGQQWIPGANLNQFRTVFRKVIDLGGLPNFATTVPVGKKTVAHGITFSANTQLTRFYGTATDPAASTITLGIPLPYIDIVGGFHVGLEIDTTNIIIRGSSNYSAYTSAYAVVEWIDEG